MISFFSTWFKINWRHFLIWLLFIFYETVLVGLIFGEYANFLTYLGHYTINITFFYFNALVSYRWAFESKKDSSFRLISVLILEAACFLFLNFLLDTMLVGYGIIVQKKPFLLSEDYTLRILFRFIYFLSFSTAYYFLTRFLNEQKKTALLEKEGLLELINRERMISDLSMAQAAYLRAQINPHFLFNTLDYIYHKNFSDPEKAGEAIIMLSQIMRYAIDSTYQNLILLQTEIEQMEKLRHLYELRKKTDLNLRIVISDEVRYLQFIPLIFLTLFENIIKHGNLSKPSHIAIMVAHADERNLYINTSNLANIPVRQGTNVGMENMKKRLESFFGNSVSFHYNLDSENYFHVFIRVPKDKTVSK